MGCRRPRFPCTTLSLHHLVVIGPRLPHSNERRFYLWSQRYRVASAVWFTQPHWALGELPCLASNTQHATTRNTQKAGEPKLSISNMNLRTGLKLRREVPLRKTLKPTQFRPTTPCRLQSDHLVTTSTQNAPTSASGGQTGPSQAKTHRRTRNGPVVVATGAQSLWWGWCEVKPCCVACGGWSRDGAQVGPRPEHRSAVPEVRTAQTPIPLPKNAMAPRPLHAH